MECPRCGFTLYEHHSACPWCGQPISLPPDTEPEAAPARAPGDMSPLPPPSPPPHEPGSGAPHVVCHFGGGAEEGWEPSSGFEIAACRRRPVLVFFGAATVAVTLVALITVMAGSPEPTRSERPSRSGLPVRPEALPEQPTISGRDAPVEVSLTTDRVRMNELAQAVAAYQHDTGELPPTLDALAQSDAASDGYCGPYVRELPKASGGRRFAYEGETGKVSLIAADGTRIDSASPPRAANGSVPASSAGLAVANAHLAALSAAISAYQRDHAANPPSLEALCEGGDRKGAYLKRLPHPPGGGDYGYEMETATVSWGDLSRTNATLLLEPGKAEFPSRDALSGKGPLGVNLTPLSRGAPQPASGR